MSSQELICTDCEHSLGLVADLPSVFNLPYVMERLILHRRAVGHGAHLFREGHGYRLTKPAWRCDLCNAIVEPPYWTYTTPVGVVQGDADGQWLVCDPCAAHVRSGDTSALVRRCVEGHTQLWLDLGLPAETVRDVIGEKVTSFIAHRHPDAVRNTAHEQPGPHDS